MQEFLESLADLQSAMVTTMKRCCALVQARL